MHRKSQVEAEDSSGSAVVGYFDLKQRLKYIKAKCSDANINVINYKPESSIIEKVCQCICFDQESVNENKSDSESNRENVKDYSFPMKTSDGEKIESSTESKLASKSDLNATEEISIGQNRLLNSCSCDGLKKLDSSESMSSFSGSDLISVFLPSPSDILFLHLDTGQTTATPTVNFSIDWGPNQECPPN